MQKFFCVQRKMHANNKTKREFPSTIDKVYFKYYFVAISPLASFDSTLTEKSKNNNDHIFTVFYPKYYYVFMRVCACVRKTESKQKNV